MSSLLSMINLNAVISCGTAIEPKYLINQKGTTPGLAMYALRCPHFDPIQFGRFGDNVNG